MIYGDPFYFSLQFDVVDNWNIPDDIWKNGIFSLYVEGNKIFDVVDVFELTTTFSFYSNAPVDKLSINDLCVDAASLYKNAREYFVGDGEVLIDGLFDMTCTAMGDNDCYLYFLKTSFGDRLVWSLRGQDIVQETILPSGTISGVINQLRKGFL